MGKRNLEAGGRGVVVEVVVVVVGVEEGVFVEVAMGEEEMEGALCAKLEEEEVGGETAAGTSGREEEGVVASPMRA